MLDARIVASNMPGTPLTDTNFQILKTLAFVVAFVVATGTQAWWPHRALAGSWRTNAGLGIVNALLLGAICVGCACSVAAWTSDRGLGVFNAVELPGWLSLLASVVVLDLVSYAWHRANHRWAWLWRFHAAHHSDRAFTVTTALRFHPGELLLALPVRLVAVITLGIPVAGLIAFEVIFVFANLIEHGNIALPVRVDRAAGRVVITPSLHRRHHVSVPRADHANFGTIFSCWDRCFGTLEVDAGEMHETGLPNLHTSLALAQILTLPLHRRGSSSRG